MRYVLGRVLSTALFGLLLFASAGRVDWARAWVYVSAVLLGELLTAAALRAVNPEILARRGSMSADAKTYDRVFVVLWLVLALVTPVVAGLDVGRSGDARVPLAGMYVGLVVMLLAYLLGAWAMAVNEHFELLVRIQMDRGHRVVTSGPYRIVRHPGYLAAIVGALASPLILGSLWAFAPVVASALLFSVRTALEDRTLREELAGYEEYAARTRHRLLPGIW
jgi:protein-S-isoprenylcysteine O-methyltransferase Ste14